jgi:hypothetical protein
MPIIQLKNSINVKSNKFNLKHILRIFVFDLYFIIALYKIAIL